MTIASQHSNFPVKSGDKIAGTRIIPLVIEKGRWHVQIRIETVCTVKTSGKPEVFVNTNGNEEIHHERPVSENDRLSSDICDRQV